ncbi:MAG TPA: tyrosine-type recombinase/integrase [Thermoanaerobaculia bacterium]|nr:tyrosine-type recombinase/integrase [Thermoanaerobaculia bacterium]
MPSVNLTDRYLKSLRTEAEREEVYDRSFPAFLVRVSKAGGKSFFFRYRGDDGRYRRMRLGAYPAVSLSEARTRAQELQVEVQRGKDPAGTRQRLSEAPTVELLAEEYLERHAKIQKRRWQEDERLLRKEVLPELGLRKAAEVRKRDVVALLDAIARRGAPILGNRVLALVRKMYNWGIEVDLVEFNPCLSVRKVGKEISRSRILSEEEIRALWHGLATAHPTVAGAFRLVLLLGQRPGEVCQMAWDQIERDQWTIPAEATKSGRTHVVPVSAPARELIESFRGQDPVHVLPAPRGAGHLDPQVLSHAAVRLRASLRIGHWTPHDLRRTVASRMAEMGIDQFHVARVLGHAYNSVTAIYNRYGYLAEKRAALEQWAARVEEIVQRTPGEDAPPTN